MTLKRYLVLLVLISILIIGPLSQAVQGSKSHSNFDKTSKDLSMLYASLDSTKEGMEKTLKNHVNVNYSLTHGEESLAYDFFNQSYDQKTLKRALNHSAKVGDDLKDFHRVYRRIEEEEVPSHAYLKENYLPFYSFSSNLTWFSRSHQGLIKNMTKVTFCINNQTDGDPSGEMIDGLRAFHNASYLAKNMRDDLNGMNQSLDRVNDRFFQLEKLRGLIKQCYDMVENYSKDLEDVVPFFENTPPYITIYYPEEVHYGEHFTVEGFYVKGGEYVENTQIEFFKNDNKTGVARTDSNGYYEANLTVGWDPEINNITLYSGSKKENVSSKKVTVDVLPWETELEAESTRKAYYDEEVVIEGGLVLDAPVNKSELEIKMGENKTLHTDSNGTFQATYRSKDFRWGRKEVRVLFPGNETVEGDETYVEFEVSVPTELKVIEGPKERYEESDRSVLITARLVNSSSRSGLKDEEVTLTIDEKEFESSHTQENGTISFRVQLQEVGEGEFHSTRLIYDGSSIYRSCRSNEMGFQVKEKKEDKRSSLFNNRLILLGLLLVLGSSGTGYYYHKKVNGGEEIKERKQFKKSEESKRTKKDIGQVPSASGPDDIDKAYVELINILDHSNVVHLTKGKTHRELGREISETLGLGDEARAVTTIFEKVNFREKEATSSEIDLFNTSIENIIQEVGS